MSRGNSRTNRRSVRVVCPTFNVTESPADPAVRRDGDRRLLGVTETNRWFGGLESRKRGGRRAPGLAVAGRIAG
jgi:hypothetical protein